MKTFLIITCVLACLLTATGLALVLGLSYIPARAALVHGDCRIVAKQKQYEYINPGRNYDGYYFYRVRSAKAVYIWLARNYYTVDVTFIPPGYDDPIYERTYRDGYIHEQSRNIAYESIAVNDTTKCWYSTRTKSHISASRQSLLVGPSWGVAIMTISLAASIIITVLVAGYCWFPFD